MIDITVDVDRKVVSIDMREYSIEQPIALIREVIDAIKYSGESISLFRVEGDYKYLVKEWH